MSGKRGQRTGIWIGIATGLAALGWLVFGRLSPTSPSAAGLNLGTGITGTPEAYLPLVLKLRTPTPSQTPPPTPTATPTATATPTPTATQQPGWLTYLNRFRTQANLLLLTENSNWSYGGQLHSRYMVKNDVITHYEDPGNPWYTVEGAQAGANGNVMVSSSVNASNVSAIDMWMTGPFHAVGILDPALRRTGFGSYREAIGTWKMGATLDVLRGLGSIPAGTTFPLPFPKAGGQAWLLSYGGGEWPDPLTSCAGYSTPSGPPIIVQIGSGDRTPQVTAHSFRRGSTQLEHCVFDETDYTNPDGGAQSTGRSVLNSRDAIVLIPRQPLATGQTYQVSITANGQTLSWSFSTISHPKGESAPAGAVFEFR